MNIHVLVVPYNGDSFEPFETTLIRPQVGEYIQRKGESTAYKVREVVVLDGFYDWKNRRHGDVMVLAEVAEARFVPHPLPL